MAEPLDVDAVPAPGFGLTEALDAMDGPWHSHARHQLLYATSGMLHLITDEAQWLLPPQRAAWIRGGTRHRVRTQGALLQTVYLDPALIAAAPGPCVVFGVSALAREMLSQAMVWGPEHDPEDPTAQAFFRALGGLSAAWCEASRPYRLPRGQSPALQRAIAYALAHLGEGLTLPGAARAAGLSPRTLNRRFRGELATTWRDFLHSARMLYAMERLLDPDIQVIEVALELGFESPGAFSRSFKRFTLETPRDHRRRGVAAQRGSPGEDA